MAKQPWESVHWDPLYRLTPDNWQYFIKGHLRTAWTKFTPEQQELLYNNAVSLSGGLKEIE